MKFRRAARSFLLAPGSLVGEAGHGISVGAARSSRDFTLVGSTCWRLCGGQSVL